ncbi:MAG: Tm-1-like ATP-binding domain-containing protein [Caldilineaceae bacterium]|nr:Tm-1-like ATP-binding domain-containing protein [Caldilineaceae bacterium]
MSQMPPISTTSTSTAIALIGSLDTKGEDFAFVKAEIERRGLAALVIDTSVMDEPAFTPNVSAAEVAEAGGSSLAALRKAGDRGAAIGVMAKGAAAILKRLHGEGQVQGVLGMGGSAGATIATTAMRGLPVGVPKVMVSTLAGGNVATYVGDSDIVMMPSIVDVAGVNSISARIYTNAAAAVCGMATATPTEIPTKPLIAASMFGNTTQLVGKCKAKLEAAGYEVLVFHATGAGGRMMEKLISEGHFVGVLDVTTTEWADELVGGTLSAGPTRLDAAAQAGIPQVIAPGCLDMVNFGPLESVPDKFGPSAGSGQSDRLFYVWNPTVTLMRTTPEENAALGLILAEKANAATGPVAFFLPANGVSILDSPGGLFWWPEADLALFDAIQLNARPDIAVEVVDANINDDAFANAVTTKLLHFLTGEE